MDCFMPWKKCIKRKCQNIPACVIYLIFAYLITWLWCHKLTSMATIISGISIKFYVCEPKSLICCRYDVCYCEEKNCKGNKHVQSLPDKKCA